MNSCQSFWFPAAHQTSPVQMKDNMHWALSKWHFGPILSKPAGNDEFSQLLGRNNLWGPRKAPPRCRTYPLKIGFYRVFGKRMAWWKCESNRVSPPLHISSHLLFFFYPTALVIEIYTTQLKQKKLLKILKIPDQLATRWDWLFNWLIPNWICDGASLAGWGCAPQQGVDPHTQNTQTGFCRLLLICLLQTISTTVYSWPCQDWHHAFIEVAKKSYILQRNYQIVSICNKGRFWLNHTKWESVKCNYK